jgi:hypothetical protein
MTNSYSRERRLALCSVLFVMLAFAPLGCKRKPAGQEAPHMASTIHMGDPQTAAQLVSGFYGIEQNAWRWTGRRFSVALRPPVGAAGGRIRARGFPTG